MGKILEVLKISTWLGLTSFGGPIAHLGYFRKEYVEKQEWLDERQYADLVALCQFLPGPASSQVGIGIGAIRAGFWGGVAAWIGFTLPSAIALMLFAFFLKGQGFVDAGWIHGLKIVAVAIVAHSVYGMGQKLASNKETATIAMIATAAVLLWHTAFTQVFIIIGAGIVGVFLFSNKESHIFEGIPALKKEKHDHGTMPFLLLVLFGALLIGLPLLFHFFPSLSSHSLVKLFDQFYRSGALVFGGGHVVLPLLELEMVPTGLMDESAFLAGYGAAQAVPGPLFTFSSYLGAMVAGFPGAVVALIAIFLPAFLLVMGVLPYWERLRKIDRVRAGLIGVNAAVVGILLAALYNPIWIHTIKTTPDFILAGALYTMLTFWKMPPWVVVLIGAIGGWLIA